MRNKGFTLIELLAVIVILAIIALIAVPIILGIIGDSKKEGNKRSIDMYADAIKNAVASYLIQNPDDDEKITLEKIKDHVKYNGNTVECEITEVYKNGKIYLDKCKVAGEDIEYKYGIKMKYENGEVVYFNVSTGEKCSAEESRSEDGTKEGCMKFYAFNDSEDSDRVNLLLDHNTTATLAWITKEDYNDDDNWSSGNNKIPLTLLERLKTDTTLSTGESWQGTETPTNYTYNYNDINYTIDYTGYNARIITVDEILRIIGCNNWDYISLLYFDSHTNEPSNTCTYGNITNCQYGWLYDRTLNNCKDFGCYNNSAQAGAYWTISANYNIGFSVAYGVAPLAFLGQVNADDDSTYGLRPVIEVLKSKLS